MSFTIFNGIIAWLLFFLIFFELLYVKLIYTVYFIVFLSSLWIFLSHRYYRFSYFITSDFKISYTLIIVLFLSTLVLGGDLVESLAPLSNYDSLSYHLAIPYDLIAKNELILPDRALTGYQPLLSHLTYIPYILFGGEDLLRIYLFICEFLIYLSITKFFLTKLNLIYSLLASLIVISLPIFIYSAGNGNIEILNLLFTLSIFFYFYFKNNIRDKYFILPALFVAFYAASKLFGLLLFASFIIYLLCNKKSFKTIFIFSSCFFIISFQWYFFIYIKTGTPFFPVFYDMLGRNDLNFWNNSQNIFFNNQINKDNHNLLFTFLNFFIYLINLFLLPINKYGGIFLSYGFIFIFSLPLFISFIIKKISSKEFNLITQNEYLQISLIFYILWYFLGSTLFFRYLMPIFIPVIVLHLMWFINYVNELRFKKLLYLTFLIILSFQISLSLLNNFNYFRYISSDETLGQFYERNVPYYGAIDWMNNNINTDNYILSDIRAFRYLSNNKILAIQPLLQNKINISTNLIDSSIFYKQITDHNIEYVILRNGPTDNTLSGLKQTSTYNKHVLNLFENKCLILYKELLVNDFGSRSINSFISAIDNFRVKIFKINDEECSI